MGSPSVVLLALDSGSTTKGRQQDRVNLTYLIFDAEDREDALEDLENTLEDTLGIYDLLTYGVAPVSDSGGKVWKGNAEYGLQTGGGAFKQTGEYTFEFDTTGAGSTRLYQALEHIADFGGNCPNHDGAINVARDKDGLRVEGVDVAPPSDAMSFSVVEYVETVDLSTYLAVSRTVNEGSWTVNLDGVQGTFATREAYYVGVNGSRRPQGDWALRHSFKAMPSVSDMQIGDITGINKAGMDYLWVEYEDVKDDDEACLVKKPIGVHVERVFREGDFSSLNLPVIPGP